MEDYHGDVTIRRIEKLPPNLKVKNTNILAHGESTGHMHTIVPLGKELEYGMSDSIRFYENEKGETYVEVLEPSWVRHQKHLPIVMDPGVYGIDIVREYDYDSNETKRVVD